MVLNLVFDNLLVWLSSCNFENIFMPEVGVQNNYCIVYSISKKPELVIGVLCQP